MKNPKCPYCGEEMEYQDEWIYPFYICSNCYSSSPKNMEIKSQEEAYAAAMKRDRAKGEWRCTDDLFELVICSICGWETDEPFGYIVGKYNFCPNCGAEMKEANDE